MPYTRPRLSQTSTSTSRYRSTATAMDTGMSAKIAVLARVTRRLVTRPASDGSFCRSCSGVATRITAKTSQRPNAAMTPLACCRSTGPDTRRYR